MSCRRDSDDPTVCPFCQQSLWVADEGLYCGGCGSVMPCTMTVFPVLGVTTMLKNKEEPVCAICGWTRANWRHDPQYFVEHPAERDSFHAFESLGMVEP